MKTVGQQYKYDAPAMRLPGAPIIYSESVSKMRQFVN